MTKPKYLGKTGKKQLVTFTIASVTARLWVDLHRLAWNPATSPQIALRLSESLGGGVFELCWKYRTVNRRTKRITKDGFIELFQFFVSLKDQTDLCRRVCASASMLVARAGSLRELAIAEKPGPLKDAYWNGFNVMLNAAYSLINTGALGKLQNTLRNFRHEGQTIDNLAAVLVDRFGVTDKAATGLIGKPWVKKKIASALGLSIFRAVRGVQDEPAAKQVKLVTDYYRDPDQRLRRGFYANIGEGIEELFLTYKEIKRQILLLTQKRAAQGDLNDGDKADLESLDRAKAVFEISLVRILDTGILFSIPS